MRTVSTPHEVREDEHAWVPMRDGVRLSARIWRPTWSDDQPVPAILEYIPYRKRDLCDGSAGMIGKSWGGFNGLQIAARQPPQLKAVVAVAFSDDRYADDVHYMGGCLLGDNLSWASTMFAFSCAPPDPALVGDRWREMWHERLEHAGPWVDTWLSHQRRDAYWSHGSVRDDYSQVKCPVLGVSGWADGYSNAVFRLLEGLDVPFRGLIGPWSHTYPHVGQPGPAVGFRPGAHNWNVIRDLAEHVSALEVLRDEGTLRFDDIDLEVSQQAWERYASTANVFTSASGETEWAMAFTRGDWAVSLVTRTRVTCTKERFHVHARLDAYEGDERIHSANWRRSIPRDHV